MMINILIFRAGILSAQESLKPINPINTMQVSARILQKTIANSHYKIIGSCAWLTGEISPKVETVAAVEQFLPDLIVTVSNIPEANPWIEAGIAFENAAARAIYQKTYQSAMGFPLGFGDDSGQITSMHMNEDRTRVVNVIGSPAALYRLPWVSHQAETKFGFPYYSSEADAVSDRTEAGELVYMATHPNLLFNHDIGGWGHEIPRLMRVTQPYRYRASVVAAMHAADIVTNKSGLHVSKSTNNSCGKNCVVANVIYDPNQTSVIWQEVYPENRNIKPGDINDFGIADDKSGNGNYIFVIWRKYKGCLQRNGKLLWVFPQVGPPQKR